MIRLILLIIILIIFFKDNLCIHLTNLKKKHFKFIAKYAKLNLKIEWFHQFK